MRLEERLPRHRPAARGRRIEPVREQDALDGVAAELVTEVTECTAKTRVAPAWILACHANDDGLQRCGRGAAPAASLRAAVVLARDQLAVPAQDRVRRNQTAKSVEDASAKHT